MSSGKRYICLDIGGTYIKHGLLTENGEILTTGKIPTRAKEGGQAVFEQAVKLVEDYLEKEEQKPSGIAISTAGMVDPETGIILHASDAIPGYAGINYKVYMEERFHLPCAVENDVNCAGLAESVSGAGKGSRINLCLTVGTGIGGCLVVDGKVFHGISYSACEVGYMHLEQGVFQDEAAASALVRRVEERKKAERQLSEDGEPSEVWDGFRIFEAAKAGDLICREELDRLAKLLGMGIANICFVVNPERVILGGGIMEQEAYMKPRIEAALEKYLVPQIWKHTTVCMAAYQNHAGMLGALYHLQAEMRLCQ